MLWDILDDRHVDAIDHPGRFRPGKEHYRWHTNAGLVQRRQKRAVHIRFGSQWFADEKRRRLWFVA